MYCATSESLALLELRVHSPHPYPRTRWRFAIGVPDDALTSVAVDELPRGWDKFPAGLTIKRFDDAWVAASSNLGLLVPSVVATEEKNLMLNPLHPRFQEVRVLSKQRVVLDKRLYSFPAKRRSSAQKRKKQ